MCSEVLKTPPEFISISENLIYCIINKDGYIEVVKEYEDVPFKTNKDISFWHTA